VLSWVLFLLLARDADARVLIWPNGERAPGEVGSLMAGAQVAVASGSEAIWYNPAGMAKERRTVLTANQIVVDTDEVSTGSSDGATARAGPGFLAWVTSPSQRRSAHRLSYGFSLTWPIRNRLETRLDSLARIGQEALPDALLGPLDLDAVFPDGIERSEAAQGMGELDVVSPGLALGFVIAPWLRTGLAIRWERVRLAERSQAFVGFSAEGPENSGDSLSGFSRTAATLEGEAARLNYVLGFQLDVARSFSAGLTYRFPSRDERGHGRVFLSRASALTVTRSHQVVLDTEDSFLVDQDEVPFELRTPGELRIGAAFLFDLFSIELDWIRRDALGGYEVFPALESDPAGGGVRQFPSVRTSLQATSSYALGLVLAMGRGASLLAGFAHDASGVPTDDAVFRHFDLTTLSAGYHFARGPFSASLGLVYRFGEESGVNFPDPGGGEVLSNDVSFSSYGFGLGFSYIL
jgi:long-subunit fatty acid transport protein